MAKHTEKPGTKVQEAASSVLFGTWQSMPHLLCGSQVQLPQLVEGTAPSLFLLIKVLLVGKDKDFLLQL